MTCSDSAEQESLTCLKCKWCGRISSIGARSRKSKTLLRPLNMKNSMQCNKSTLMDIIRLTNLADQSISNDLELWTLRNYGQLPREKELWDTTLVSTKRQWKLSLKLLHKLLGKTFSKDLLSLTWLGEAYQLQTHLQRNYSSWLHKLALITIQKLWAILS